MVILASSKYESDGEVLKSLKFIQLVFSEIKVADIATAKNGKNKRLCKRNTSVDGN